MEFLDEIEVNGNILVIERNGHCFHKCFVCGQGGHTQSQVRACKQQQLKKDPSTKFDDKTSKLLSLSHCEHWWQKLLWYIFSSW